MLTATFDSLAYAEALEKAGFTREQAVVQAEAMRKQDEALRASIKEQFSHNGNELATKMDLAQLQLALRLEIKNAEMRLLKWEIGLTMALAFIMAKGFHWLGF